VISNDWWGIHLNSALNNTIINNNVTDSSVGIYLFRSSGNSIIRNRPYGNNYGFRIDKNSNGNIITNNTIEDQTMGLYIWQFSMNNIISFNFIKNTGAGLDLVDDSDNNIIYNNVFYQNGYGIKSFSTSNGNLIYHNSFIDNFNQAIDEGTNFWDNGYPSGGNFWSNYTGVDNFSGPNQDIPGSDGIGDSNYSISSGINIDNYPLINPIIDLLTPSSSVDEIDPFWYKSTYITINSTAMDIGGGSVAEVTLWYRYSSDNTTWGAWFPFEIDNLEPWSWDFNFPDGDGHYQFFSIATDNFGNSEPIKNIFEAECGLDFIKPFSKVNTINPYIYNRTHEIITATGDDQNGSGIKDVTLWYRFSTDNISFSNWISQEKDENQPWIWDFFYPDGEGYYEFYSIANDINNNIEDQPSFADTICVYDATIPHIIDNSQPIGTTGDNYSFQAIITDNFEISYVNITYWFDNGVIYNHAMELQTPDTYKLNITIPLNGLAPLYYIISAQDIASNWFILSEKSVTIEDNDNPKANISPIQSTEIGSIMTFNGSASTDNIGINNYSWTFTYNNSQITLYGNSPEFVFFMGGDYVITLNVTDFADNWNITTKIVNITFPTLIDKISPIAHAGINQQVKTGSMVILNGTLSSDNVAISNYTWTFTYNGSTVTLFGPLSQFIFWSPGDYAITLKVTDTSGNWNTDIVSILVTTDQIDPPDTNDEKKEKGVWYQDYWWLFVIIIICLIIVVIIIYKIRRKPPSTEEQNNHLSSED
jgi:parallel beta-helix repeat protein